MDRRRGTRGGFVALAVGCVLLGQGAASAAELTDRGVWSFDEPGAPTTAVDSSGLGNHGTDTDIVGDGTAYQFNGTSSRVTVPDSDSLDPGTADFSFGVQVRMTAPPDVGDTYDVLRKGLASTRGGAYKLEVKRVQGTARARCMVKDSAKVLVAMMAPTNLADGLFHTVTCTRTGSTLTVKVDDRAPRSKTVTTLGSVVNASSVGLGAKAESTATTGFDWFRGEIGGAWVRIAEPPAPLP